MSKKANGTHAKEVAIHFLNATTDGRYTRLMIAKTINIAKSILTSGFTKEEIIAVIDYFVNKGVNMYSLGYISATIGDALKEVQKDVRSREAQQEMQKLEEHAKSQQSEVSVNDESAERNRAKLTRFGVQSGVREKHHFDLFEGHGQDNGSRE